MSSPFLHALNGSWSFFARLNTPQPDPDASSLQAFFARAYSMENDGMVMAVVTIAVTVLLELLPGSVSGLRKLFKSKGGPKLYAQGVLYNFLNNVVLGPPVYELVCNQWMSPPFSAVDRVAMVFAIIVGHSIGYYCAHRWMHTRTMYWAHRFHHRFNVVVVPVSANAVSLAEYIIAYMLPFVVGAALLRPDRLSLFAAVGIISFNSLLIHTPDLADASARLVPSLFVSTADHLEHHRRLTAHYAAPTFSVDRLLASVVGKPASWNSKFDAPEQVRSGAHQKDS
jgi:sterol desaturase/sphingolipid hydroxylase (fatty acid hydroxylase superfamily)